MAGTAALQRLAACLWTLLDWTGAALCHPLVAVLQVAGALALGGLGAGWILATQKRSGEAKRLREERIYGRPRPAQAFDLPAVSVILPVRGVHSHSCSNWTSHLRAEYKGPLEFIFVVDSAKDSAVPELKQLFRDHPDVNASVEISGPATTCSQKIHNQHYGLCRSARDSKYVLFLDDDVQLHPRSIQLLAEVLELDSSKFMATGFPFDIPPVDSGLPVYCIMAFHMPLLIAFSVCQETKFVWGGCMMIRREALDTDAYGILEAWTDGGYSDDLIVAAKCSEHNLRIAAPLTAVFPQRLDAVCSWSSFWNYLRRQMFVLDTYASSQNRRINYSLAAAHFVASCAVALPILEALLRVVLWQIELVLVLTRHVFSGEDASLDWPRAFQLSSCSAQSWGTVAYLVIWLVAHIGFMRMTGAIFDLFRELSPEADVREVDFMHFVRFWAGMVVSNLTLPVCLAYTMLHDRVTWSEVSYVKSGGKVVCKGRETSGREWKLPP
ncbi:unnamed protein product [Ostreobium quekettii]|uniref:ceramide glucosyltransferase n=1 Tax=Ostreobium quekettii TaxID=121088 RepID=A0A8S1J339_9CHLO|nr:unnamed protein product [Ostreobium quekettii]|eukprot:evm.model.scf_467.3 EVM.evm.TU.scf_467.3   scf_467:25218-32417(-)